MVAIVLLAVGVVAVQAFVGATTKVTIVSNELQTASMLAGAMHERCLGLERDTLLGLDDHSYSPPLDSQANTLTELADYRQAVDVSYVDPRSIQSTSSTETDLLRISVTVSRNGKSVLTSSRLIATTKED